MTWFRKCPKMMRFLEEPRYNGKEIIDKVLMAKLEEEKAWGKYASVFGLIPHKWNIYNIAP